MSQNQNFQDKIITRLGLQNSSNEAQDEIVQQIALAARAKIVNATQDILSQDQLNELENRLSTANSSEELDNIAEWVENQIPDFNDLFLSTIEDIVDEIVQRRHQIENS